MRAKNNIKIGIVIGSGYVPAWVGNAISEIRKLPQCSIAYRVDVSTGENLLAYAPQTRGLRAWYENLDRRVFRDSATDAFANPTAPESILTEASLTAHISGGLVYAGENEVAKIEQMEVDFLLNFCPVALSEELSGYAQCGVLEGRIGSDERSYSDLSLLAGMVRGNVVIRTDLVLKNSAGEESVVERSRSGIEGYSIFRVRNPLYWKMSLQPARYLRRVSDGIDSKAPDVTAMQAQPESKADRVSAVPLILNLGWRYLRARLDMSRFRDRWSLVLNETVEGAESKSSHIAIEGYTVADPFLFEYEGKVGCFYELLELGAPRACIAYSEVNGAGEMSKANVVLERPYHLSYPIVFEFDNNIYMLPETRSNKTIELYRAEEYPHRWVPDRVLFENVNAVDTTVFVRDGLVWLLTCMAPDGGSTREELFLFYSDSLHGDWTPHPLNPVISDVELARPGGALFWEGEHLIRPSQDNTVRYGYAINYNVITAFDKQRYEESLVAKILPTDHGEFHATHTSNTVGRFTVLDAERQVAKKQALGLPVIDFEITENENRVSIPDLLSGRLAGFRSIGGSATYSSRSNGVHRNNSATADGDSELASKLSVTSMIAAPYSGATLFAIILDNDALLSCDGETFSDRADQICGCGQKQIDCDYFLDIGSHMRKAGTNGWDSSTFRHVPAFSSFKLLDRLLAGFCSPPVLAGLQSAMSKLPLMRARRDKFLVAHERFMRESLRSKGASVYVDGSKVPRRTEIFAASDIFDLSALHVIRDARGFCNSFRRNMKCDDMGDAARRWNSEIAKVDALRLRFPSLDFHVVRYEDLCSNLIETMAEIRQFLGLPTDCQIEFDAEIKTHVIGNRMRIGFDGVIKEDLSWKSDLSAADIDKIESISGEGMRRFGYL